MLEAVSDQHVLAYSLRHELYFPGDLLGSDRLDFCLKRLCQKAGKCGPFLPQTGA